MSPMFYFYFHEAVAIFLLATFFLGLGVFCGWMTWRNSQLNLVAFRDENQQMMQEFETREQSRLQAERELEAIGNA